MKKRNGFTLVELLAVIVVLAIIIIIAIPSVLDVMDRARKSSFVIYAEKVVTAVQTQYVYDANMGSIAGAGYYVYDITQDLNLTSTGSYKGYIVVDASNVDDVNYILTMYDNNYEISNYNITTSGMPTTSTDQLRSYGSETGLATNALKACNNATGNETTVCYTREGYKITSGSN